MPNFGTAMEQSVITFFPHTSLLRIGEFHIMQKNKHRSTIKYYSIWKMFYGLWDGIEEINKTYRQC